MSEDKSPEVRCAHDKLVPVDELIPHPRNPNKHPRKQIELLAKIMRQQGVRRPIVASKRSGFLVIGHGRLEAAKLNGWATFPVDYQDYESEAMEYADMVADNKIAELAEIDMDMVKEDSLKLPDDFDGELMGVPNFEIPKDLSDIKEEAADKEPPPPPEDPVTTLGDVYELGDHKLVCGDATESKSYDKALNGCLVDLTVTDPPYGVDYDGGKNPKQQKREKIKNDSIDESGLSDLLRGAFKNIRSHKKKGGPFYIFHSCIWTRVFIDAVADSGLLLKQNLVWAKQRITFGRRDYQQKHEPIMYGWAPGGPHPWYSDRKQHTVWEFDRPFNNKVHPTMKPIDLLEYPIKNSSRKGDIVLDPFGGSGSTLIACERTGRKCAMIELDPGYCDVIIKRWEEMTGKKARKIS